MIAGVESHLFSFFPFVPFLSYILSATRARDKTRNTPGYLYTDHDFEQAQPTKTNLPCERPARSARTATTPVSVARVKIKTPTPKRFSRQNFWKRSSANPVSPCSFLCFTTEALIRVFASRRKTEAFSSTNLLLFVLPSSLVERPGKQKRTPKKGIWRFLWHRKQFCPLVSFFAARHLSQNSPFQHPLRRADQKNHT
jgi:hypothetical protein